MPRWSPTREGLRAVARTPALWLAEIAWRWAFGLGSLLLCALGGLLLTRSLHVSHSDLQLLRTNDPWLASGALANILQDARAPMLRVIAVLVPAIAILWTFAAAVGRTATLNALLRDPAIRFRGLLGLSILRTAVTLAAIIGFFGAAAFAGRVLVRSTDPNVAMSQVMRITAIVTIVGFFVLCAWTLLNWLFSLAAVFVARNRRSTMNAVAEALHACRSNWREFGEVSTWYGLWHTLLLIVAAAAAGGIVSVANPAAAIVTVVLVTAVYFALVDFLYVARLAAYVAIVEGPPARDVPVACTPDVLGGAELHSTPSTDAGS